MNFPNNHRKGEGGQGKLWTFCAFAVNNCCRFEFFLTSENAMKYKGWLITFIDKYMLFVFNSMKHHMEKEKYTKFPTFLTFIFHSSPPWVSINAFKSCSGAGAGYFDRRWNHDQFITVSIHANLGTVAQ